MEEVHVKNVELLRGWKNAAALAVLLALSCCPGYAQTPLLTGAPTAASARNDYSGFVGMSFAVGATPIKVLSLGRLYLSGNSRTHIVKLVDVATGNDVPNASVSLTMTPGTANTFEYAQLSTPITLPAYARYFLVTQESAGGDTWYDYAPVTGDPAVTVNNPAYQQSNGAYSTLNVASSSYVPPNLLFTLTTVSTTAPPYVVITQPAPGTVSDSIQLTATAAADTGLHITGVQFRFRGTNVGSVLAASPYSFTLDTKTLANGDGDLTAVATDSSANTGTSSPVHLTISNVVTTPTGTAFIRSGPAASAVLRNDYAGFVGTKFTVGGTPLQVSQLGRWVAAGNGGTHTIKLVQNSFVDVPGGSVSLNLAGKPTGQYAYAALASPVTLSANTTYYLVTQEAAGGDRWYDYSAVTADPAGMLNGPAFQQGNGAYSTLGVASSSFGPPNFLFSTGTTTTPPPSVTVSGVLPGTVSGSIPLTATASAYPGLNIASVQYKFKGTAVSPVLTVSPYSFPLDTTTLPNGDGDLTAVATDTANNVGTSAPIALTISNVVTTPTGTAFIRSAPAASAALRNDYTGFIGGQFTVGGTALQVTQLGRWMAAGNSGTHIVKLIQFINGMDVPGGSVSLNLAGKTPGKYAYAPLTSPVTLAANAIYYLVTQESAGGDQWYDYSVVAADPAATLNAPAFQQSNGAYTTLGVASAAYGPPNFLFSTATVGTPPPTVSITEPLAGTVSGTITVKATASAYTGLSITGVQFQFQGVNVGPVLTTPPYNYTLDTTTLNNGMGNLTAVATDSAGNSRTSDPLALTINNPVTTPTGAAFIRSGPAAGAVLRNDYSGFVGTQFVVGGTALKVNQLGRWMVAGNNGTHIVKLVQGNGVDVPGGSVSLNMTGKPVGQYAYANLAAPVTLTANDTYYLVTQETAGGDKWYDYSTVTADPSGTLNGPAFQQSNGAYTTLGVASSSFGPPNFLFSIPMTTPPPSVSITAPLPGTVSGTITVSAAASAYTGLSITGVQFQFQGVNVGPVLTTPPYSYMLNTTALNNGMGNLTAVATDSAGNSRTSDPLALTINNPVTTPTGAAFIRTPPAANAVLRNDYSGFVGAQLFVGGTDLQVSQLGRWMVIGNSGTHIVKLVQNNGMDVPGGSVSLNLFGKTSGRYVYATLSAPVTLTANGTYFLVTQEFAGGDQWYDYGFLTADPAGTLGAPAYQQSNGGYATLGILSSSYGPPNFLFTTGSAPPPPNAPTVVITSPAAGMVSGTITLSATATPAPGLSIVSTQFTLNDAPVSSPLDTTTLVNGMYTLKAKATDSNGVTGTSDPVQITVNNAGSTTNPLLVGTPASSLRNDYTGFIGMKFTVGAAPIKVNQLGRWVAETTTAPHTVKLLDGISGNDLVGGSATIAVGAVAGGFVYAPLQSPITLQANHPYFLVTQETSGGDKWYDAGAVTANSSVSVNGPAYQQSNGAFTLLSSGPSAYGTVSLQFAF
jgi:hypothetical protein